jgi:hypothetical protein
MINGEYGHHDRSMLIAIIPTSGTLESIAAQQSAAKALFETTPIEKRVGETLQQEKLYRLVFSLQAFISTFTVNVDETRPYVIFTEHNPYEFEDKYHFLKDSVGVNIEPIAEDPSVQSLIGDKNGVGSAIGASLISALCALVGVLTFVPGVGESIQASNAAAFGSGSLLSCAMMLMVGAPGSADDPV